MPVHGQTLSVTLTPTDTVDYTNATATVSINVNQATLSVTSFTPTTTGFQTVFSGLLNTSALTLAAVTLTGNPRRALPLAPSLVPSWSIRWAATAGSLSSSAAKPVSAVLRCYMAFCRTTLIP